MHSSYKISNSSDSLHHKVETPAAVLRLHSDKKSDELKFFIRSGLEVRKLSATPEDVEDSVLAETTESLSIEPHSFNLLATPVTRELLLAEERLRARELARAAEGGVPDTDAEPVAAAAPVEKQRRMFGGVKTSSKPNIRDPGKHPSPAPGPGLVNRAADSKQIFRRSQLEKQRALTGGEGGPALPRAPIPAADLPPAQMRSPPVSGGKSAVPVNPLLQNLKPIPQQAAASRPAAGGKADLISIQVPMAGADGAQTMQTINIPRSVLAGASDRPILLTVTPKNGVNKGQKQIVVLTRNNGQTSAQVHVPRAPGASPSKSPGVSPAKIPVQLSPRAGQPQPRPPAPPTLPPPAAAAVPSTVISRAAATAPAVQQQPQPQAAQQPQQSRQVIRGSIVQTSSGQVLVQGNKQILLGNNVIQNGKLMLSPAQLAQLQAGGAAAAAAPRPQPAATRSVITGAQLQSMMAQGQKIVSVGTSAGGQQVVRIVANQQQPAPAAPATPPQRPALLQNGGGASPATAATPPATSQGATASLSRILTALHNRGLVSQQNGKFYYVGDKSKAPVSISPGTAVKLATSSGIAISASSAASASPLAGIQSLGRSAEPPQQVVRPPPQQQAAAVVVAPAASLDSFTADSDMMMMATSMLGTQQQQQKVPDPAAVSGSTESFCYRDRLLPPGWYVKIGKKQVAEYSYEVETSFYSPEGAMLTSQEQVAAYMSGQLSVDTIGHRPPVPVSQMPWRDELSEINQQLAPAFTSRPASVSKDLIVENRSATTEGPGFPAAQNRPSQDEIYHTVDVLVTEDQYADFYDNHLGGTDKEKDIYEENKLLQV